ncbi:MAG: CMP-N-acetylneuraminic acid synthetase [Elusimicrobia bacterium RIFOXYD12_FULL_66_9]|nr:MAG: CMP-N-acetylneuraminic acid synthetase [Elusimicrobia bacterium RIFOXYD12_FULL_66_9]
MNIRLGKTEITPDSRSYIIAEACENHLGNMAIARETVLQAKLAGADAIKFQHHLPDEEMLKGAPMSDNFDKDEPLYDFLKRCSLKLDQHAELKALCEKVGIQYMCTPFSYAAAVDLLKIDIDAFKIGSGEMTDIPSLQKIASLGKPMLLSTGMCTFDEIDETYRALKATDIPFALFNCVSEYPPKYEDVNLRVLEEMRRRWPDVLIGHSDHTPDIYTCFAAVPLGARFLEKHVTLDKRSPGPDQSVSIDMRDLRELVDGVRKIEAALGAVKKVHDKERPIRTWAHRSVVSVKDIAAGAVIAEGMVWTKRPGTGIPSKDLPKVLGRKAKRALPKDTILSWEDLA